MSLKKEASGRRSIQVEIEVPGTPEEVWQAIATGPGISAWFVPAEFEEKGGKPAAVKLDFGPGDGVPLRGDDLGSAAEVRQGGRGLGPGLAADGDRVHRRSAGRRHLCGPRGAEPVRQHGRLGRATDRPEGGWPGIFRILRLYLTHFRGQRSAIMQFMAPVPGTAAGAWKTLTAAVGLHGVDDGQRWAAPPASRPLAAWWSTSAIVHTAPCCGSTSRDPAPPRWAPSSSATRSWRP